MLCDLILTWEKLPVKQANKKSPKCNWGQTQAEYLAALKGELTSVDTHLAEAEVGDIQGMTASTRLALRGIA